MSVQKRSHRGQVVVSGDECLRGHGRCDPGAARDRQRGDAGAGLNEQRVGVSVIAAVEFDDEVAPGGGPGHPQGAHGRLRAAVDEPQAFDRRHA